MKSALRLGALLWLAIALPATADPIDDLRARWLNALVGDEHLDRSDNAISTRIAQATYDATQLRESMAKSPATAPELWPGLHSDTISADITTTARRLAIMSVAYALPGSPLHRDKPLLAELTAGLDWVLKNRYHAQVTQRFNNWWDWEIGVPVNLNQVLVCTYGDLPPATFQGCTDAIEHFTPKIIATGANGLWRADIVLRRGILVKDDAKLQAAREWLSTTGTQYWEPPADPVKEPFPEGFYRDGSFIAHGAHPYNGGYGFSNLSFAADLTALLSGTVWDLTGPNRGNIYRWFVDSFRPIYYRGQMFDDMRGREIARPLVPPVADAERNPPNGPVKQPTAAGLVKLLLPLIPGAPPEYKLLLQGYVKGFASPAMFPYLNVPQIPALRALLDDPAVPASPPPVLFKHFPVMTRTVMLRPTFGASVAMHSASIYNYEFGNTENSRGWHTGDGWLQILNADARQFAASYWPTVDWHRLPGTTVIHDSTRRSNQRNGSRWAGGADLDGVYGATGLELQIKTAAGQTLAARKSWFMFDDEIVCLGSGITADAAEPVETILENRRLNAPWYGVLTADGLPQPEAMGEVKTVTARWLHLGAGGAASDCDLGFIFTQPTTVQTLRQSRAGSWKEIDGYFGDETKRTSVFQTLWLDHGAKPANASYAYTILPGIPAHTVGHYAADPNTVILVNTPEVHAVRQKKLGIVAANFWTDAPVSVPLGEDRTFTVNRRACVLLRRQSGKLELAIADPTLDYRGTITVTLNRPSAKVLEAGKYFRVDALQPHTVVTLDLANVKPNEWGQTFEIELAE